MFIEQRGARGRCATIAHFQRVGGFHPSRLTDAFPASPVGAISNLLRAVEAWLRSRGYPIEYFGWQETGHWIDDFGVRIARGRWHLSEAEREPYYRHDREIMWMRAWCRARLNATTAGKE